MNVDPVAPTPAPIMPGEAQTLRGVLSEFEDSGYTGQFGARVGGVVRCFTCAHDFESADAVVETLRRLEGASDPDDMLAVLPITCPICGTKGTLVLKYGPESSLEESDVLAGLPEPERPPSWSRLR